MTITGPAWRRFTAIEVVMALVVLGIVTTTFIGQFHLLRKMQVAFLQESRCLRVLDNTVERLAAETEVSTALATAVLEEEFAAETIPGKSTLTPLCIARPSGLAIVIRKANGHAAAEVEIPR